MKTLLRFIFIYLPVILILAIGGFALLGTEKEAAVVSTRAPTTADAARAHAFAGRAVGQIIDARTETTLIFGEKDIDGMFALLSRGIPRLVGDADISDNGLAVAATLRLPQNPFRNFVNLRFGMKPFATGLTLSDATIGTIRVPGPAVVAMLQYGLDAALGDDTGKRLLQSVRSVQFRKDQAHLRIRPLPDLKGRLLAFSERLKGVRDGVALLGDRETITVYYAKLVELERVNWDRRNFSLAEILAPLFVLARDRSSFGAPTDENQAALMALIIYLGDSRFEKLTGPVRTGVLQGHHGRSEPVTLNGRHDLLLHFIISAGLKVVADQGVAMAIGEFKELLDSNRGGTGFSFVDLGADRTGLMFAEMATASEVSVLAP
jgi:hypothetical protein